MASLQRQFARPEQRSPIFRLPIELRQQIYSYLLPPEHVSHPLPSVGISSVSHRPPSTALLNVHPVLTREILDYFYTLATWKLVFNHAFNFFRVDPDLRQLAASPVLAYIRSVEMVFFCDNLLMLSYPSFGIENFCLEIQRRAARACDVLRRGAPRLRSVVVSWVDTTEVGTWEAKASMLMPLRTLLEVSEEKKASVTFRVGEISGPSLDRNMFVTAMREVLGQKDALDSRYNEDKDDDDERWITQYGLLAYDMRQTRQTLTQPGSFPIRGIPQRGWRAAPRQLNPWAEQETEVEVAG